MFRWFYAIKNTLRDTFFLSYFLFYMFDLLEIKHNIFDRFNN